MRWPPLPDILRAVLPSGVTLTTSLLGFSDAQGWEKWAFGLGGIAAVGYPIVELFNTIRYIEPRSVRKRAHNLLRRMSGTLFPADDSLVITLFVLNSTDGDGLLTPIVRYDASRPDRYNPDSRARFRTDSSTIIKQAWQKPGILATQPVPSTTFPTDDVARGWFMNQLRVSEAEVKRLSHRTLRRTSSLCDVALSVPFLADRSFALLSLSSEKAQAFDFNDDRLEMLRRYLESLALMVAPIT